MTQWFTSDLHLAHPFVAKLRGFEDYREHDETIIRNLNTMVQPGDELYVLGDISSGGRASMEEALRQLHRLKVGRTHRTLILGNHDTTRLEAGRIRRFITEFGQVALRGTTTIHGYGNVLLSHYPYACCMDDTQRDDLSTNATSSSLAHLAIPPENIVLLHGHTHARQAEEFEGPYTQINVGVDAWDMMPVPEWKIRKMLPRNGYIF